MFHQQSAAGRASGCVLVENDTYGELRYQGDPVLVSQGRHLVATFHPELTPDPRIHRLFLESIA
jgi:glutamine amidotransferase PdxT